MPAGLADAGQGAAGIHSPAVPSSVPASSAIHSLVDGYLRHLTIERGLSRNTLSAYRRDLGRYEAWLAAQGIDSFEAIGEGEIGAFTRQLTTEVPDASTGVTAPLAASSVARIVSSVRGLHRFLAEEGQAPVNAAREVKPPKLPSRLPKAISIEQMTALLEATGGDEPAAIRDRALLELLYATGARVSEVVALNVDDVAAVGGGSGAAGASPVASAADGDFADAGFVRVLGKGSKQRLVPVGSFARVALDAYLVRVRPLYSARGRSTPALFLGLRGDRLSRQGAWLIIQAAARRAGLSAHISPHTFRHSFATHLIAGGADVRVVQDLLGHASVTTTQIYTHVTADTLRDMYQTAHPRAR